MSETLEERELPSEPRADAVPGIVLVFSAGAPALRPFALRESPLELGRHPAIVDDEHMSRRHATVAHDGARWIITDRESRNGTFVDGARISKRVVLEAPRVVRLGRSLFVPVPDVRPFEQGAIERAGDALVGPTLREAWSRIGRAAAHGDTLLIAGESGAGKELAAREFHAKGDHAAGPFVAVNCAAIPEGLAERLLFGARRGAYSGATADAEGYVQAADRGVLFLDEIAELDPAVQAKLLRVIESKEVVPLGASRARRVELRVCAATHNLRAEVAAGRFRQDLYFRIGRPEVVLPPLRQRREEIPWLLARELGRLQQDLRAHVAFVEACLLRPWPGNVRELLGEVRSAGQEALAAGRSTVELRDLAPDAGEALGPTVPAHREARSAAPDRQAIEETLRAENGNVTAAARALGLHRNQLRRWLAKHGIDPKGIGLSRPDTT